MKLLRGLVFFITVPGSIFVYLPLLLALYGPHNPSPYLILRWIGGLTWSLGLSLAAWSVISLSGAGKGTPAPNAPPERLVTSGVYRYSRNPMYLAAMAMVLGYAFWFQTWAQWLYFGLAVVFFIMMVVRFEEPGLHRKYGKAYAQYCRDVPRWLG